MEPRKAATAGPNAFLCLLYLAALGLLPVTCGAQYAQRSERPLPPARKESPEGPLPGGGLAPAALPPRQWPPAVESDERDPVFPTGPNR